MLTPTTFEIEQADAAPEASIGAKTLGRTLPWYRVALLLSQYSSAGVLVLMPSFFGSFGYIGGPMWLAVWMGCSTYVGFQLTPVLLRHPQVSSYGELGYVLMGRPGRALFLFGQLGDLVLYVAVAITFIREDFVYGLAAAGDANVLQTCGAAWAVGTWATLTLAVQFFRTFKDGVYSIAFVGAALVFIKLLLLIYDAGAERATYQDRPPMQAFGPLSDDPTTRWSAFFLGTSTALFANVSPFFQAELMAEMVEPAEYPRALVWSSAAMFIFYCLGGLFVPAAWGWNVAYVVTATPALPGGPAGIAAEWPNALVSLFVGFSTGVDYLMSQVAINRFVCELVARDFDYASRTCTTAKRWLLVSLPCTCSTIVLALFVPTLGELLSLVTGLSIPLGIATFPAVALIHYSRREEQKLQLMQNSVRDSLSQSAVAARWARRWHHDLALGTTAVLGVVLSVGVLAQVSTRWRGLPSAYAQSGGGERTPCRCPYR